MEKRCRLCMKATDDLQNILDYDAENHTTIVQNISLFFAVDITLTDHLPKDVCQACIKLVNFISNRRKIFIENQDQLKDELYSALKKTCTNRTLIKRQESVQYKLSDLKIPTNLRKENIFPTVEIINLEESDIIKEYKKISEHTFRKIKPIIRPVMKINHTYFNKKKQTAKRTPPCNFESIKLEPTIPENVIIKEEQPTVPVSEWSGYQEMSHEHSIFGNSEESEEFVENEVVDKVFLCSLCNAVFNDEQSLFFHNKTHNIKTEESTA